MQKRPSEPTGGLFCKSMQVYLALAGFKPALCFVDHINTALAAHNATVAVPVLK